MFWNVLRVQSLNSTAFRRLHGRLMASRFLPCHRPVTTYSGGGIFISLLRVRQILFFRLSSNACFFRCQLTFVFATSQRNGLQRYKDNRNRLPYRCQHPVHHMQYYISSYSSNSIFPAFIKRLFLSMKSGCCCCNFRQNRSFSKMLWNPSKH